MNPQTIHRRKLGQQYPSADVQNGLIKCPQPGSNRGAREELLAATAGPSGRAADAPSPRRPGQPHHQGWLAHDRGRHI